jgi:SAM-dependent methyltransferase
MTELEGRVRSTRRLAAIVAPLQLLRLARGNPVSSQWGWDRGNPIDRHFIELFLAERRGDIRGRVLEVKDAEYTRRFGSQIERSDVLDIDASNRDATIVDDLASGETIADSSFDCLLLTQTLQYVYDVRAAVRTARRILRPGGILLATLPGISRVSTARPGAPADYWRFTKASCRELATREFADPDPEIRLYGNALSSAAFIAGLSAHELPAGRLAVHDERFPVLLALRAVRR